MVLQGDTWNHEAKLNQYRVAHGVVSYNDLIHVIGGSASAGDVGSFGVGVKGLEVLDIKENHGEIYSWITLSSLISFTHLKYILSTV